MRFFAACLLLVCLLAGCAQHPATETPGRPPAGKINAFTLTGRLAVRQGEQRHHVQIDWQHDDKNDRILLATPLGQGIAELSRDSGGARLELADHRRFSAADWDALAVEVFGIRLPLSGATRWLLGDVADTEGWQVRILDRESTAPHALPIDLEFERDDLAVRLKVDAWNDVR